jgi:ribonuclease P/MRP protein subunit RPP40
MSFNTDKCIVMHLGNKNLKHNYVINGVPMKTTTCEKDIGVYIQPSLKPSVHIAECVKKANRVLGMLLRNLSFRDKYHFIRLYKQYVRCHLENAVQVWNPWLIQDIENIESVQRRAIKSCHGLHGSYEEKLKQVGLTTLCDRRVRGDMLQTFKIMHRIDDVDPKTWFTKVNERQQTTRSAVCVSGDGEVVQRMNLMQPKARLDVRKNFFSCRVVDSWNKLPSSVQEAADVNDFKQKYDVVMAGNLR